MPELPGRRIYSVSRGRLAHNATEVERAAALIRSLALGKIIVEVDTVQDDIVFSGITHTEFVRTIRQDTIAC